MEPAARQLDSIAVHLERDVFFRTILRHLSGALQDIVGVNEAAGFVSLVGQHVGDQLNASYREAIGVDRLDRRQVAAVLVDLKRRIQGDFFVIEENEERIVLGNRACPFGDLVAGRPTLCMMTSNVFGRIVADNLGYGRVDLESTIAAGHAGCRVVIHLRPTDDVPAGGVTSREYYRS
jgi:predicted ArsR family transcriptional regulator